MTFTSYQQKRAETIEAATGLILAGEDEAAVEVAEYLVDLAAAVVLWAKTPGNHGGNPYTKSMVRIAEGLGYYVET